MRYDNQEIWLKSGNQSIYGYCFIPDSKVEKKPTVLFVHGYSGSYLDNLSCAEVCAEKGIASISIDFPGGCPNSKSGGDVCNSSITIEIQQLLDLFKQVKQLPFVDDKAIYLYGESQGGFVSAMAATTLKDQIKGLILIYPAFNIVDMVHEIFKEKNNIPETSVFLDQKVGRCYSEDIWNLKPYEEIGKYQGRVLLIHGTSDTLVPQSYSDKAEEIYENVEYYLIEGANHGFHGKELAESNEIVLHYILKSERETI